MESIRELRKKVAKSTVSHYAPAHDKVVRKISVYFTWLLLHTPFSANAVTVLQTLIGVFGALLLISANLFVNIFGVALLQFGYVLDCCDGEVARYRKQASVNGVFLDLIGHEIVVPFMYMGLAFGEFQRTERIETLLFGFSLAIFSLRFDISAMFQTVNTLFMKSDNPSYNFETLQKKPASTTTRLATTKPSLFRILFRYPESMNVITILLFFEVVFPCFVSAPYSLIYFFLLIYGALVPLARIYSIYQIFRSSEVEKRYKEIVEKTIRSSHRSKRDSFSRNG